MFFVRLFLTAIALMGTAQLIAAAERSLLLQDQVEQSAQLAAIVDDAWTFTINGQAQTVASDQIVRFGAPAAVIKTPLIFLRSGGRIVLQDIALARRELVGYPSAAFDELKVPLRLVRGIAFRLPLDDRKRQTLFARIENYAGIDDQLLLENGDVISGLIAAIQSDAIQLETAKDSLVIERTRVAAVLFAPSLASPPQDSIAAWIGLRDGSLLATRDLKMTEDGMEALISRDVALQSIPGLKIERDLIYVAPQSPRVVYLSDLPEIRSKQISYLTTPWGFQRDQNVLGGDLSVAGIVYRKGLGVHSTSRLACPIPQGFQRFAAEIAIDDSAGGEGSVRFRVYLATADGKWKLAYQSEIIRGGMRPKPINVPLGDSKAIALMVDFADRGDVNDRADWLSARFEK